MNLVQRVHAMLAIVPSIMCKISITERNCKRGTMATNSSPVLGTLERRRGRSVHYNISYLVQGAEYGPDGAVVLLHELPAGAFTWEGIIGQLAGLQRAVYAFD